jgi:hypothetical protein
LEKLDLERKQVRMRLPEGLLEVNEKNSCQLPVASKIKSVH